MAKRSAIKKAGPRRRRAAAERPASLDDRLLDAIARLLDGGTRFAALPVEQLAREAGIGRATFYLHFRDKTDLVARLMQRLTAEVALSAGDWFRDSGEVDERTMRQALFGIIGTFKRHQAVLAAVADTAPHDPVIAQAHADMMQALCALSRRAVRQVQRSGRGTAVDPAALADLLTHLIELYCARFIADYRTRDIPALVDLFAHVAGRAIFAPPARSAR
jgi:TetR/AcrR family transcriptional regulator, ethionamide resistance regulator